MRIVSLLPGATESLFALGLAPCRLTEPRARREAKRMAASIAATGAGRVLVFAGSAYSNRPGPRLVDSLELLATATTPVR